MGSGSGSEEGPVDILHEKLKADYEKCSSQLGWTYCIMGTVISLPIGIHKKSLVPLYVGMMAGTAADFAGNYQHCSVQRNTLKKYEQILHDRRLKAYQASTQDQ